ncbi:PKD domain-containing protein [Limisalsivibrio acetivorans]|uniref:PKD domain-containing protein n=1 Tax=Limisalsivibrio acetivorans TaxID=1304888 RepID=UPI000428F1A1|nr:PKD domain-containing protein [Limisalsivibrio acetivorans]
MRRSLLAVIITVLFTFMLTAGCGGGGSSTADKKESVQLALGNALPLVEDDMNLGPVSVDKVYLDILKEGSVDVRTDITSAMMRGERSVSVEITSGTQYDFRIRAYGKGSDLLCEDNATAFVESNAVTEIDLLCAFQDQGVISSLFFEMFSYLDSEQVTTEGFGEFLAADFGMMDGMDRSTFIDQIVYDNDRNGPAPLQDTEVTKLEKISDTEYEGVVKAIYEDGTTERLRGIVKNENGNWYMAGNGKAFHSWVRSTNVKVTKADDSVVKLAGLFIEAENMGDKDISYIMVVGAGLPEGGLKLVPNTYDDEHKGFVIAEYYNATDTDLSNMNLYRMQDTQITQISDGSMYTFNAYDNNGDLTASTTESIGARPYTTGEMTSALFAMPSETLSHDAAEFFTNPFTAEISNPAGYTPLRMEAELSAYSESGHYDEWKQLRVDGNASVSFNTGSLSDTPMLAYFKTVALDSSGRASVWKWYAKSTYENIHPVVSISQPAEPTVTAGVVFDLVATAYDADGQITGWSINFGDGTVITSDDNITQTVQRENSLTFHASHSYSEKGTYTVTVTAFDDAEGSGTTTVSLNATEPQNPFVVEILNPSDGGSFQTGESVYFNADIQPVEGESLSSVQWSFGDGGSSTDNPTSHTYSAAGTYSVLVEAYDTAGNYGYDYTTLTVEQGQTPPSVEILSPADGSVFTITGTGIPVTFDGSATDSDGTVSSINWSFGDGGTASIEDPTHEYTTPGTYTVSLTAVDDDNLTSTDSISITIDSSGTAPTISITEPTDNAEVYKGTDVTFKATASDPDGGAVTIGWDFGDGSYGSGAETTHPFNSTGTYTVQAKAEDEDNMTTTASVTIKVIESNSPPSVTILEPGNGSTYYTHETINFDASATDPEGDSISSVQWFFGDGNTAGTYNASHSYPTAGTYTVKFQATDSNGNTGESTISISILQ